MVVLIIVHNYRVFKRSKWAQMEAELCVQMVYFDNFTELGVAGGKYNFDNLVFDCFDFLLTLNVPGFGSTRSPVQLCLSSKSREFERKNPS